MATGNSTSALDPGARNAYWEVVEDCLVEFHKRPRAKAVAETQDLRRQLEPPPKGIDGDVIYHDEPFYVACDIAGLHDTKEQDRLLQSYSQKYESIKAIHHW